MTRETEVEGLARMVLEAGTAAPLEAPLQHRPDGQGAASFKPGATFFAGTTHYSADYLDRMNIQVRHLEAHIAAVKDYQTALYDYQRSLHSASKAEGSGPGQPVASPPIFNTASLPALPVMHEWTMDLLGTALFVPRCMGSRPTR